MKIKTFQIEEPNRLPEILQQAFNEEEYCVIDIETTGLNPKYSRVILIGILYRVNNITILKQFFAESPKEERQILVEFYNIFKDFNFVVTYNGASFDIPFLKKRFAYNKLDWDFDGIKHIDTFQFVRKERKLLNIEDFKLKTVEKFLGINRKDTISGRESVLLYNEYVKNPTPSIEKTILLHNYEDIYYLNKLLSIFDYISVNKYDITGKDIIVNYNLQDIIFTFYPKDISIKKGTLYINGQGSIFKNILDIVHYDPNFQFNWYASKGMFDFTMPLNEGYLSTKEKCIYADLGNFNLSASSFNKSSYYNEKFFPNNFIILKCDNSINVGLIGELVTILFEKIIHTSL